MPRRALWGTLRPQGRGHGLWAAAWRAGTRPAQAAGSWALGWVLGLLRALAGFFLPPSRRPRGPAPRPEPWGSSPERRVYQSQGAGLPLFTVQTVPWAFQVELARLAEESAYFGALARSQMQEAAAGRLVLEHVPSGAFRAILDFVFLGRFGLGEDELLPAVQAASYLQVPSFLERCWLALRPRLRPHNCLAYLRFAEAVGCPEMRAELCGYLSTQLLELAPVTGQLGPALQGELARLRTRGPPRLCVLRKENLGAPAPPGEEPPRGLYCLAPGQGGAWRQASRLPFRAHKWSFSTAQLLNYLFLVGGYRERRGARGFAFRMAAFRYNPLAGSWQPTAPPLKRRRHFSMAVVEQRIYAIGGWYLDTLLAPDSGTALYAAVERYDPWADAWAFVSSLPLTDFTFAVSLAHDLPLCTAHAGSIYALGSVAHTGEKLLLRYDVRADTWQELLPTLTRADADLPCLYFLGGAEPLYVLGGNFRENVLIPFSPTARRWGPARSLPKCSLAGQGAALGSCLFMAAPELGSLLALELGSLDCWPLPAPPFPLAYEALFFLHFPGGEQEGERGQVGATGPGASRGSESGPPSWLGW
ncbi:LOW QUALITY PROTEIN: kelch repeat and BTB domain-containing protein 13-like [Pelodiscus sinensis]|uniref:LOW QUALITY PROTEIN: kelch repeat and BTB domain-containing protein 13-like n=1 Tax=Pelodiscus sinensis TaxID=13735 RepID=UPI003F6D78E0